MTAVKVYANDYFGNDIEQYDLATRTHFGTFANTSQFAFCPAPS